MKQRKRKSTAEEEKYPTGGGGVWEAEKGNWSKWRKSQRKFGRRFFVLEFYWSMLRLNQGLWGVASMSFVDLVMMGKWASEFWAHDVKLQT